jgi:hypothetical protein
MPQYPTWISYLDILLILVVSRRGSVVPLNFDGVA